MLKLVSIGSLIVCHLYTGQSITTLEGTKPQVKKVMGTIIDIKNKKQYYENIEKKIVKEYEHPFLIVKEKNTDIIYDINSNACMTVVAENDDDKKNRIQGKSKNKEIVIKDSIVNDEISGIKTEDIPEKDFMKDVVYPDVKEIINENVLPKTNEIIKSKKNSPNNEKSMEKKTEQELRFEKEMKELEQELRKK